MQEKQRLLDLKRKYDSGEISEADIPIKDILEIVKIYNEDTQRINENTEKIKNRIKGMLEELKQ